MGNRTIVRRVLGVALTAGCIAAVGCAATTPDRPADGAVARTQAAAIVVAEVNSAPITMASLVDMMNRLTAQAQSAQPETAEEVRKRALDRLILQELAFQRATALSLKPQPNAVDQALANFRDNTGGEEQMRAYLAARSLTEADLRRQVERSLTIEVLYAREVLDKITLPEDEMRKEYERERQRFTTPEKTVVVDIFVMRGKSAKKARAKARQLRSTVLADPRQDPWNLVLDGSFIVRKLDVTKQAHPELYAAARPLAAQGISAVVETQDGCHVLKLQAYTPEKQFSYEEARHLIEGPFRIRAQDARLQEWERELRAPALIVIKEAAMPVQPAGGAGPDGQK